MQSLQWYARRMSFMSPAEICWRARAMLQAWADRCMMPLRTKPISVERLVGAGFNGGLTNPHVLGDLPSPDDQLTDPPGTQGWRTTLIARAEKICRNHLSFLSVVDAPGHRPLNWNYEYEAQRSTPLGCAAAIDYRDYALTGDAKLVWELNRHQHLVVLGRAYRITGNEAYAHKVVEHLESWMQQCPFGRGMNWRSPLELAIRLINWVWALELIRPALRPNDAFRSRLLTAAYRHLWDISRKYSRYSSVGNHLIGEAAGVFIGSCCFSGLRRAHSWRQEAREILLREMETQTHEDGGHRELSVGYHLFALEFFLAAGLAARNCGGDFPPCYWQRLERMFDFVATLAEGGDGLPMFGDGDDGYVLDLGQGTDRVGGLLAIGAALWDRSDFRTLASGSCEAVLWSLGRDAYERLVSTDRKAWDGRLSSKAFRQTGYYVLQHGQAGRGDSISVVFDCGELGLPPLAGHGHADALSFTLRVSGVPVLVDPGTYDYFRFPAWRDCFRSTRAHNTVVVDDCDQSVMAGRFLWGARARARCLRFEASANGGAVVGEHDGYARLESPVIHRRRLVLDGPARTLSVLDEFITAGQHEVKLFFHFAPQCRILERDASRFTVDTGTGQVMMELDERLTIQSFEGCETPIAGWVSDGYHRRAPAITLVGQCTISGNTALRSMISFGDSVREAPHRHSVIRGVRQPV